VGDLVNESLQAQQENSQPVIDQQPKRGQTLAEQFALKFLLLLA
jgi:hypothetical protein